MSFVQPLRDYVDALVHPSAQQDPLVASRHRAFIAPRLLGSLVALAAMPVYLAMRGVPTTLEVAVLAWLVAPMLIAYFLSRTGRYEGAHILSSLALTCLVFLLALRTGGIASFAAIWFVVVPLEAALSGSRRIVAAASAFALGAAGLLLALPGTGLISMPEPQPIGHNALAALGVISASLYAAGLALAAESLTRTSSGLLSAEEDRYRLLARNMTDVITRHGQNGAVLFVSPAAGALFGAGTGELLGHGLFDRVHVADRPAYLSALADAAGGESQHSVEFRVKRPVADRDCAVEFVWIEMRCRRLDQSEEGQHVVAVMRDISDRKSQEQALDTARSESEHANAAKTRFLATMSHELRTPLNAIIGFSEMLINEEQMRLDATRRREYAQLINDSGNHLLAVVNGILDMSKMETGDFEITPEPFAPAVVINNCCDILILKAQNAGIDVLVRNIGDLPDITADKRAFKQIMLNLLSNALKFTDRGGRIVITSRLENGRLLVSVEDNGIGIAATDLPRIGSPFFQAGSAYDRRHDGTGLGLSIVKGLVALHGGEMQVRSELGKGTSILIDLPVDCEKVTPLKQRTGTPTPFELARKQNEVAARKSA